MKVVFENLTKAYPSRDKKKGGEVIAVNNFSFEIPDGKLIGLLGPSGCGKSTTLHLLSGLQKPTNGRIYFGEDDVTDVPAENRGVGLVFQNYALYPHLTVMENIIFPLQNRKGKDKLKKEEMHEMARETAKLVQIEELLYRKPNELSGGQQQRVAIARALVKEPSILLLDEPLSNLDARLRLQTREEIKRIQEQTKVTTIFVTHDQEEAMSISDLIIVMKDGVVHQIGAPQEVYDNPNNLFVATFLGTPPINLFKGKIENNKVYIGDNAILNTNVEDVSEVTVAIRPEGFLPVENGSFSCNLQRVEVMGRDISVIAEHECCEKPSFRAIVRSENLISLNGNTVSFDVLPHKVFVFNPNTGDRII